MAVTHTTRSPIVVRQNVEGKDTVTIEGSFPCCIVYVKCGSNNLMRKFERSLGRLVADSEPVEFVTGTDGVERATAYRLWGTESALGELTSHAAVIRWHYVSAARVPSVGTARGDERQKVHDHVRPTDAGAKRTVRHARAARPAKLVIEFDEINPERRRAILASEPGKRKFDNGLEKCFTADGGFFAPVETVGEELAAERLAERLAERRELERETREAAERHKAALAGIPSVRLNPEPTW